MTRPINLYLQSRISAPVPFSRVMRHATGDAEHPKTGPHEMGSLRILSDALLRCGLSVSALDGFFFSYSIPRIGKEFDLLKLNGNECLNVELKSRAVPESEILDQLLKNRYYLAHVGRPASFFTVVTDTLAVYALTEAGELRHADLSEVAERVKAMEGAHLREIDRLFRASVYLISPLHTPERFLRGEYFLTTQQAQICKEILKGIRGDRERRTRYFSITGKPGTGKTLLLYDLARRLTDAGEVILIHTGRLPESAAELNRSIGRFRLISSAEVTREKLRGAAFLLVDEAHRLGAETLDLLCRVAEEDCRTVLFSSDPAEILTASAHQVGIAARIAKLPLAGAYRLSGKIRTNRALSEFIGAVQDLSARPTVPIDPEDLTLAYAGSPEEAGRLIAYFREQGYVFIHRKSDLCPQGTDGYEADYDADYDARDVVGQEFDCVLMLMDGSFCYDAAGKLRGRDDPERVCPQLFYEGISRVREKLALVVVGAPELFERISSIL